MERKNFLPERNRTFLFKCARWSKYGFCRKFSSVDILGEYSRPGGGLCGQSVELFGHGEALLDPTCKLPFAQHVHQFDANQSGLRRVKRFEP